MRDISISCLYLVILLLSIAGCNTNNSTSSTELTNAKGQPVYQDVPYLQDISTKYYFSPSHKLSNLSAISANRDAQIRVLSDSGVVVPDNGSLFYAGKLIRDISFPPLYPKKTSV